MADALALHAAAWLATVALHGVLIAALVALATRRMRSGPARERAWKLALVGALVTATAQLGLGVDPVGGAIVLHRPAPTARPTSVPVPHAPLAAWPSHPVAALPAHLEHAAFPGAGARPAPHDALPGPGRDVFLPFTATAHAPLLELDAPATASPQSPLARLRRDASSRAASLDAFDLVRGALVAWAAIAAAGLALWTLRWRRLARQVADRRPLAGEPLRALEDLCARAGRARPVRLCATASLAAPITFGLARAEICLPERALAELAPDELRAMLAHELAHVVRRDPHWLALAGVLERVLFFQPLARFARRRWQEEAELACDDLAVRWTDERLSLATCLTEVAGWLLHEPRALAGLPVPSMALAAHGRAGLGRRVRRLIDERPARGERGSRWMVPLGVAGLASVVAAAPRIAPTATSRVMTPEVAVEIAPARPFRGLATDAAERVELPLSTGQASDAIDTPDGTDAIATEALAARLAPAAPVAAPVAAPAPRPTPPAFAPEALHVIGPHGLADVLPAAPEPGLDDVLHGLERSIALLEAELSAIADEARTRELDGWTERIERLERRIERLGEQHERLAATAALLVALETTTTDVPTGASPMTLDEVKR